MKKEYKITESGFPKFKAVLDTESGTIKVMKLFYGYKRYQTIALVSLEAITRIIEQNDSYKMHTDPMFNLTYSSRRLQTIVQLITGKEV